MKDKPTGHIASTDVERQLQVLLHRLSAAFLDLNDEALRLRENLLVIDSTQRTALLIARATNSSRSQAGSAPPPMPQQPGD